MGSKLFKAGAEISLTIDDVSFKAEVGRQTKEKVFEKIKIPLEWKNALKDFDIGCECIVSCKMDDQTYKQYKMILMEKELDGIHPIIHLKMFKEFEKYSELRKDTRIKTFIFTTISENESLEEKINQENGIDGTISDVSKKGCLLMSEHSFNLNHCLQIVFSLLDEGPQLKIKCLVKNKRKSHMERCFYYGLEFLNLETKEEEAIQTLIKDFNRQG
jgi:c-di-GMP-binding flagellar brake protein YcgR